MELLDHTELARLMRDRGKGARRLAPRVGLGKSTIGRLQRGEHRSTRAEAALAIEDELEVPRGTLFREPEAPRVKCTCDCHGAAAA